MVYTIGRIILLFFNIFNLSQKNILYFLALIYNFFIFTRQNKKVVLIYILLILINQKLACPNGGTGRRTRLKIVRETMWVRVPLWAP